MDDRRRTYSKVKTSSSWVEHPWSGTRQSGTPFAKPFAIPSAKKSSWQRKKLEELAKNLASNRHGGPFMRGKPYDDSRHRFDLCPVRVLAWVQIGVYVPRPS